MPWPERTGETNLEDRWLRNGPGCDDGGRRQIRLTGAAVRQRGPSAHKQSERFAHHRMASLWGPRVRKRSMFPEPAQRHCWGRLCLAPAKRSSACDPGKRSGRLETLPFARASRMPHTPNRATRPTSSLRPRGASHNPAKTHSRSPDYSCLDRWPPSHRARRPSTSPRPRS